MYGNDGRHGKSDENGELLAELAALDGESAAERAYELGVIDACKQSPRASATVRDRMAALAQVDTERALERLRGTGDTSYDRSLINLAYDEGRTRGLKLVRDGDGAEAVWEKLVGETTDADVEGTKSETFEEALPGALGRLRAFDVEPDTGPPETLSLPTFLRERGGPGRRGGSESNGRE